VIGHRRKRSFYRLSSKNQGYLDSVGNALNLGVNERVDVLRRFYLDEVAD
jgi:hypothetical protein